VGNGIVHDPHFDWGDDNFVAPKLHELVIYEMHIGTFNGASEGSPGTLHDVAEKFNHLKRLGVNAIQIMPTAEFAGDYSWGYNPAHIFAVESAYGGPKALKKLVKDAHQAGLAVILDVVYNHFGPSDLDLWQFDGWSENGGGGIYFYNDWKAETPWGNTRPDYGRGEVRQFIRDNALMWIEDFHMDGLRYDMTLFIRNVRGHETPGDELPEGWGLTQWINGEIREKFPNVITIAEDLRDNAYLTKSPGEGGAGFHSQWDARFVHPVRGAVIPQEDQHRSMTAIRDAIATIYNGDAFQRVIYSESHDEVANGKSRVPSEISPQDPEGVYSQKRSVQAAVMVFTAPGVPMLFQGQEFLENGWFRDDVPLDWDKSQEFRGIVRLYADLAKLRLNRQGFSRGLMGHGVKPHHVDDLNKVIAFHRWDKGGPGDDVIVVLNLSNQLLENYRVGFPAGGLWKLRLNTDWEGYSKDFTNHSASDVTADGEAWSNYPTIGVVQLAPYSALIYTQDAPPPEPADASPSTTEGPSATGKKPR